MYKGKTISEDDPSIDFYEFTGEHVRNSIHYQRITTETNIDEIENNFLLKEGDILLSAYPRTGSTWTSFIIYLIKNHNRLDEITDKCLFVEFPLIELEEENSELSLFSLAKKSNRLMRSHLNVNFFRRHLNCGAKFIVTLRNPKDMLISLYNLYKICKELGPITRPFDDFFDLFVYKRLIYGDQFDFVKGWWMEKENKNILILHYEDMKRDIKGTIKKISNFLNIHNIKESSIDEIVNRVQISVMKKNKNVNGSSFRHNFINDDYIRKGIVGDWKGTLTKEQNDFIEEKCKILFEECGCEFKFS